MKERISSYYEAIRSVRTSTWVLLIIAIGSNMLYYQVRPDPMVDSSGTRKQPDVTVPATDVDRPATGGTTDTTSTTTTTTEAAPVTTVATATTTVTTDDPEQPSEPDDVTTTTVTPAGGEAPPGDGNQAGIPDADPSAEDPGSG